MDFTTGLMSAIMTITLFSPFLYAVYIGRKQKKNIEDSFEQEIRLNDYNFELKETWGNSFIGIDRIKSKLIYMRCTKSELVKEVISLETIKSCTVLNDELRQKTNDRIKVKLLKVELELSMSGHTKSTKRLNFFDSYSYSMEDHETERAEKWKKLILSELTAMKSVNKVA